MTEIGWSHLFSRFGNRGNSSSEENIRRAVQEMYHEDYASLSEGNYVEHPDAWINYGFDSGPVYMLTIRRFGELLLEKRLDQNENGKVILAEHVAKALDRLYGPAILKH